jgi:hypothetical protein
MKTPPPMGVSADDPKTVDYPEEETTLAQAKLPEARQPGVLQ